MFSKFVLPRLVGVLFSVVALLIFVGQAAANERPSPEIVVHEFNWRPHNSRVIEAASGTLHLRLSVTNSSDASLECWSGQATLTCNGKLCARAAAPDALLQRPEELEPGAAADGWLAFSIRATTPGEPTLRLRWKTDQTTQEIDLNSELRRITEFRTTRVGPDEVLCIVTFRRTIDALTLWLLDDLLRGLKADGIERVALDAHVKGRERLSHDIAGWLASAGQNQPMTRRVGFQPRAAAPVQFLEFHVSGFDPRGQTTSGFLHESRELAVAAALSSAYERLPAERAIDALDSEYPGVRRAALISAVDRMTDEQLKRLLGRLDSVLPTMRLLIIDQLDRVTHPIARATLRRILLASLEHASDAPERVQPSQAVSAAARTLIRCIGSDTESAVVEIWNAAGNDSPLRAEMMQEILRTEDYRWIRQAAEFAAHHLDRSSVGTDQASGEELPQESLDSDSGVVSNGVTQSLLANVLRFLHANDPTFIDVARMRLLHVTDPDVQDVLLEIVLDHGGPQDAQLAERCVEQRLAGTSISRELLEAIRRVPSSDWTDQLLELHGNGKLPGHQRLPILQALLSCANDDQLNRVIDSFSEFDRYSRVHILQQLVSMDHPRHLEILAESLDSEDAFFGHALRQVSQNPSPELLRLLLDHLEPLREAVWSAGLADKRSFHRTQQLLTQVAEFDHPDAQRQLNTFLICPVADLRRDAAQLTARNASRSQIRRQLGELWNAKKEQKYEESLRAVTDLIEQDPFYSEFYVFRASLLMRDNRVRESLADIEKADQLSPGDVITESTLALCRVRLGETEAGLRDAEAVLGRVPAEAGRMYMWTLYNTACVYGRAIGQPAATEDDRKRYRTRGMELFTESVDAGIHDEDHVRNDPDLNTFHDHPDWARLMQRITDNQEQPPW